MSVRISEVILGSTILILAGLVLTQPVFATTLLFIWLSLSLFFAGYEGIMTGSSGFGLSGWQRAISLIAGLIIVGLSIAVFLFLLGGDEGVPSPVQLLSVGLLALGGSGIGKGIVEKYMVDWARFMHVIVGAVTVGLAIAVIAIPAFGLLSIYSVFATILIVNGARFVIAGVTGAIYAPIGPRSAGDSAKRRPWESDAA